MLYNHVVAKHKSGELRCPATALISIVVKSTESIIGNLEVKAQVRKYIICLE